MTSCFCIKWGKEKEDRTKLENQQKQDTQVPTKLQMYLFFSQKMLEDGKDPPPSNACVCVREKQGRKIKTQNEGGGERNQINARIYAPVYMYVSKSLK